MKKIIQFSFLTVTLAIIYFTNVSYSSGPPTNSATAGCSCHGPASSNAAVAVSFNGGNLYYTNGQTYPITISVVSSTAKPAAGFALSTNIGTLGTAPSGTQKSGNVWMHSSPKSTSGVSTTFASWTINWTAPASGAVPLQIFAVGNAVNLAGGSSGDEWAFATSLNVALPVVFTNFTASSFEKNTILNWSIANEKNVKEYQIERSENGIDFSTIGKVEANLLATYQFIDESKSNTSLAYYRIKAIDIDGKFISSKIIKVEKESKSSSVKIYPTIVTGNTPIHIQHNESQAELMIYNMNGQLVKTQQVTSSTSNFVLNEISKGIYFVFIKTNNNTSFVDKITLN
jgi:hypothetical protein